MSASDADQVDAAHHEPASREPRPAPAHAENDGLAPPAQVIEPLQGESVAADPSAGTGDGAPIEGHPDGLRSNWYDEDRDGIPSDARISRYAGDEDWFGEPRFSGATPHRPKALRWLVFLVLLGLFGMAVATLGRQYAGQLTRLVMPQAGTPATSSPARARELLDEGERALAEGDLESAKENFDKATVIDERDPRALLGLARLAAVRADLDWLKVRLLPPDQPLLIAATQRQLSEMSLRAQKAADRASAVDADNPHVVLVKVDSLRIAGELAKARALVVRLESISQQPETSFVLAALDLDEPTPNFATVTDRLKTAASAEGPLMRARGIYVYALVRAGMLTDARIELERITASPRPHALLGELRAFVARAGGSAPEQATPTSDVDAGKRAPSDSRASGLIRPREDAPPSTSPTDYRALLRQAAKAFAAHEYGRSEEFYRSALMAHPHDTEALSGLGDCARARGDRQLAISHYEQVIDRNPSYVPAVGALADIRWENGDRAGASGLYRHLIELAPSSVSAARAKERLAELDPAAPAAAPTEEPASDEPGATP